MKRRVLTSQRTSRHSKVSPRNVFTRSDGWLLLSVIYSGAPADRDRLREIGDRINFAIFTDEELEGGLARLRKAGHVIARRGNYTPSPAVKRWYTSARATKVHKDLERAWRFLGVDQEQKSRD